MPMRQWKRFSLALSFALFGSAIPNTIPQLQTFSGRFQWAWNSYGGSGAV